MVFENFIKISPRYWGKKIVLSYNKFFFLKTNVKKALELWCRFVKGKYYENITLALTL